MKATKKKMVDFSAVEMEDSWECSLCWKEQSYQQMAMQEIFEWDLICPDCYENL
jgi:hypothetical protein